MLMDNTMFMAFAMEKDDYDRKVRDCARDIADGMNEEQALEFYDVEWKDVEEALKYLW